MCIRIKQLQTIANDQKPESTRDNGGNGALMMCMWSHCFLGEDLVFNVFSYPYPCSSYWHERSCYRFGLCESQPITTFPHQNVVE